MKRFLFFLVLLTNLLSFKAHTFEAAVAMPDSYSANAAKRVLQEGGNAIDAAITAQFVLAVTLPEAGNIGGGGFMTIYQNGQADFLDYREVAPLAASKNMYLDDDGNVIEHLSSFGILSSGVPGTVDGMWQAHQKYGSKPWHSLLAPAIKLASEGFNVHPVLAKGVQWRIDTFNEKNIKVNFAKYFGGIKANTVFKQPELAATLQRIATKGRDGFYKGETAKIISQFMYENNGIITEADLASYQAKWRKPIQMKWREFEVITAPPPSSGGIAVLQWLTMFDLLKQEQYIPHNSKHYIHLLSEIGKRVFSDRAEYLGDPDFVKVPVNKLLNQTYLQSRVANVSRTQISSTEKMKPGLNESKDTTHFSIIDKWGNSVANTTTINYTFGSGVVVEGAGFILNDEMDDFSVKPGEPNLFGAVGGAANEIQPKKRMLSSMSPTILLKKGKVKMVTGSPGGTTIITSVYQSILNVIEFNMSAQQAVNAPRFHHQLLPKNEIWHFHCIDKEILQALNDMGYKTIPDTFGDLQLIVKHGKTLSAASEQNEFSRGVSLVFD